MSFFKAVDSFASFRFLSRSDLPSINSENLQKEPSEHFKEELSSNVRYQKWLLDKGFLPEENGKVKGTMQKLQMAVDVGADVLLTLPALITSHKVTMLNLMKGSGHSAEIYQYVGTALKADREFTLKAIQRYPRSFEHARENLQSDEEVALEAIKGDPELFAHASSELRSNPEFVLKALKLASQGGLEAMGKVLIAMDDSLKQEGSHEDFWKRADELYQGIFVGPEVQQSSGVEEVKISSRSSSERPPIHSRGSTPEVRE